MGKVRAELGKCVLLMCRFPRYTVFANFYSKKKEN